MEEDVGISVKEDRKIRREKASYSASVIALRIGVLFAVIGGNELFPNLTFIARVGAHEDSFKSTYPFGFSGATYFLRMLSTIGTALTATCAGTVSDRIGRRPCLLVSSFFGVVATILQYTCRSRFWVFSGASLVRSLVKFTLPVALAYASDVHHERHEKDREIGILLACSMLGATGGGVIAIVMEYLDFGLFSPLLVSATLNLIGVLLMYIFVVEPKQRTAGKRDEVSIPESSNGGQQTINVLATGTVLAGALLDNIGSLGVFPLLLTPLAFNRFFYDQVEAREQPLLSETGFRWSLVSVGVPVVVGAALSPRVFSRLGVVGSCVLSNILTALGVAACLGIAMLEPSRDSLFGFMALVYCVIPFTVLSQLTTGPLLDRLAPVHRRGFLQGVNVTIMSATNSIVPWILGLLSDHVGTGPTLILTIVVSVLAAVVNTFLFRFTDLRDVYSPLMSEWRVHSTLESVEVSLI